MTDALRIWYSAEQKTEMCSLGEMHAIEVMGSKLLGPVVDRVTVPVHGSGYTGLADVREDRQGRRYHQVLVVDFHGGGGWYQPETKQHFNTRPSRARKQPGAVMRDTWGRLIDGAGDLALDGTV